MRDHIRDLSLLVYKVGNWVLWTGKCEWPLSGVLLEHPIAVTVRAFVAMT